MAHRAPSVQPAVARHPRRIGKLYAGRHGIVGALEEDLIDVSKESRETLRGLRHTPAGAFGSARFKLGPEAVLEKLVHAIESERPHARYHVTTPTRFMALARRVLPQRLLDHVLDKASDQ